MHVHTKSHAYIYWGCPKINAISFDCEFFNQFGLDKKVFDGEKFAYI